jgi:hypothetical protein
VNLKSATVRLVAFGRHEWMGSGWKANAMNLKAALKAALVIENEMRN